MYEKPVKPTRKKWLRGWIDLFFQESEDMINMRKMFRFFLLSVLFFVLIVVCTFAAVIKLPRKTKLPNFIGKDVIHALKLLQKEGLDVYVYEKPSARVIRGRVMYQVPHPGTIVKEGRTILLTLSQGKEIGKMPHFIGMPYVEAKKNLMKTFEDIRLPLNVMRVRRMDNTIPRGHIISQSPLPGASLGTNEDVVFVVSAGSVSSRFEVEQYRWRSYMDVKQELEEAGIDVLIKKRYSYERNYWNKVFIQNIPKGTMIYEGDTLILYVGIPVDDVIVNRDLTHVEILRLYDFEVPLLENEESSVSHRMVSLYVIDANGKNKVLEEKFPQGVSVKLPYKTVGSGYVEIHLENSFYMRQDY